MIIELARRPDGTVNLYMPLASFVTGMISVVPVVVVPPAVPLPDVLPVPGFPELFPVDGALITSTSTAFAAVDNLYPVGGLMVMVSTSPSSALPATMMFPV